VPHQLLQGLELFWYRSITSVFSRRNDASQEPTMSSGVSPALSRTQSMLREGPATLLASTIFCRIPGRAASQLPMIVSVAE
jgi:hypothetical protein